jgi:hypothetical protein
VIATGIGTVVATRPVTIVTAMAYRVREKDYRDDCSQDFDRDRLL